MTGINHLKIMRIIDMNNPKYCTYAFATLIFLTGNFSTAVYAQTAVKSATPSAKAKANKKVHPGFLKIQELWPDTPPAPEGYPSREMIQIAFFAGQIKLIEKPKSIPDEIQEFRNVEYSKVNGKSLKLNLYVPKNLKGPVPCLVFIHGGAWKKGKKEDYLFYNLHFAKKGYVTASISYRLSGEAKFPAAVQDVNCAIRWIRANAKEYSINPEQIGAVGGSAGGHLAMLAGFSDDPVLEGKEGNLDQSSKFQAIVNFYGPSDLTSEDVRGRGEPISFFGKTIDEAPDMYALGSPIKHLTKDAPPILTFHGTIDKIVNVNQSDKLHKRLDELGVVNYYDRLEGWPHTMDISKNVNEHCRYIIEKFLEKHLSLPE